jgi:hypothetical protein
LPPLAPPAASPTSASSEFTLEFSREGSLSAGGVTINWGPDTAQIPLTGSHGIYTGSYSGEFGAVVSGICSGSYSYPVSVDVSAKENGSTNLEFSVTATMSMSGVLSCATGPVGNAPVTFTHSFILPAEDGASKVFSVPMQSYGQLNDTFTLSIR